MPTLEERYQEARFQVLRGGLEQSRGRLISFGALPGGANPNWDDMARGLLADPKMWNGVPLANCPQALQDELNKRLRDVDKISGHIRDALKEQEDKAPGGGATWGQIGRSFMNNPLGFLGALFQGLMALFNGEGMEGFQRAFAPIVAPVAASDIANSVGRRLRDDRTLDLTPIQIGQIATTVGNNVMSENRVTPPPALQPTQAQRNEQAAAESQAVRNTFHTEVLKSFGVSAGAGGTFAPLPEPANTTPAQTAQRNEARTRLTTLQMATMGQFNLETPEGRRQFTELTNTLSGAMHTAATDGQARTPEQVRDFIESRLQERAVEMGFSGGRADLNANRIMRNIANSTAIAYVQQRHVDNTPATQPATQRFIEAATTENRDIASRVQASVVGQITEQLAPLQDGAIAAGTTLLNMFSSLAAPFTSSTITATTPANPADAAAFTVTISPEQNEVLRTQVETFLNAQTPDTRATSATVNTYTTAFNGALTRVLQNDPGLQNDPRGLSAGVALALLNDDTIVTIDGQQTTIGTSIRNTARARAAQIVGGSWLVGSVGAPQDNGQDATIVSGVPRNPGLASMIQTALPFDLSTIVTLTGVPAAVAQETPSPSGISERVQDTLSRRVASIPEILRGEAVTPLAPEHRIAGVQDVVNGTWYIPTPWGNFGPGSRER